VVNTVHARILFELGINDFIFISVSN
jgi:hypothetical protein